MAYLFSQTQDTSVGNTTTETSLLQSTLTLPANEVVSGFSIRLHMIGQYSTAAVPGTMRLKIYIGSAVVGDTGAFTPAANLSASNAWEATWILTFRSDGAAATESATGTLLMSSSAAILSPANIVMIASLNPTVNLTISNVFDVKLTWSTADGANVMTTVNAVVEVYNV